MPARSAARRCEREKALHAAFDSVEIEPSPSLLRECREDLRVRVDRGSAQPAAAVRSGWWDTLSCDRDSRLRPSGGHAASGGRADADRAGILRGARCCPGP